MMQQKTFSFQQQIRRAVGRQQRKAAGYLNTKTAHWTRRRKICFLALTCLGFSFAITGLLVSAFIHPHALPQIRKPPVRIHIDSIQHLSHSKSTTK